MNVSRFNHNERVAHGFSHLIEIDYTDLNDTAGTTKTLTLFDGVPGGMLLRNAARRVITPFDGGATSELTSTIGRTGDADGVMAAKSCHADATSIEFAQADGLAAIIGALTSSATTTQAEFNALRDAIVNAVKGGGILLTAADDITALFTSTGANLSALTTGKLQILLDLVELQVAARPYVSG